MPDMISEVFIERKALLEAFRVLKKLCKPQSGEEAVLSFDGACLHFELGGITVAPAATGEWSGQARVTGDYVLTLAKLPPPGDPVTIKVVEERLHIGSSSHGCHWQTPWSRMIELPMNPTPAQVMALSFDYSAEEIEKSGYAKVVAQAQERAARRLNAAAKLLKDFNVTVEELSDFAYATLKRHHRKLK